MFVVSLLVVMIMNVIDVVCSENMLVSVVVIVNFSVMRFDVLFISVLFLRMCISCGGM